MKYIVKHEGHKLYNLILKRKGLWAESYSQFGSSVENRNFTHGPALFHPIKKPVKPMLPLGYLL